jgi:putative peptidoglycan lipid II flippase
MHDDQPSLSGLSSPDLLRLDPVIVPAGPPPGLEPPRRRPKAYEPAPPTTLERNKARARLAARGDRGLVLLGIVGALLLLSILGLLVGRSQHDGKSSVDSSSPVRLLPVQRVDDFDPQGDDKVENPKEAPLAADGNLSTGWQTSTYLGSAQLGGLKDGVGIRLDLGGTREVDSIRIRLAGAPTTFSVYASSARTSRAPVTVTGLRRVASIDRSGGDSSVSLQPGVMTRYLVVWLQTVPRISAGRFQGEIREVSVRGRS